ncbi:MAG: carboxypeptidase regulatory-like domain-containing protein, partial [Elusimicrobia bacterium]|nr:carboxypeptidase regulatory-like domain-containing protein [Elusimicrobiota bacterium]
MKKNILLFAIAFCFSLVPVLEASNLVWSTKVDMPTGRCHLVASTVNNKIYAIGGSSDSVIFTKVEEFNPSANTWVTKTDMPTSRVAPVSGIVNNKIYVIGGDPATKRKVEEYDVSYDSWSDKANMTTARNTFAAGVVNNKIYCIGGDSGGTALNTVEEFDPVGNTWVTKTNMPTARYGLAAAVVNNKIYAIGGWDTSYSNVVEEYDPVLNSWATKANMPTARLFSAATVLGNKIYVIGGCNAVGYCNNVEVYDPVNNTWSTETSISIARDALAVVTANNKIYTIGGRSSPPLTTYHVAVEEGIITPSDGLVAYWNFDEGAGTTLYDQSGNGNDGTIVGATWITGKINNGLSFDGVNDYVGLSFKAVNILGGSDTMTAEFWINPQAAITPAGEGRFFNDDDSGRSISVNVWNDKIRVLDLSTEVISPESITFGNWYHVAAVKKLNNYLKLYVNGQLVSSSTLTSAWNAAGNIMRIGSRSDGVWGLYKGILDEIRIYNRELSQTEIQTDMGSGQPTYSISGYVKDASSVAVSGVTVSLSGSVSVTTTTAGDGSYTFGGLLIGNYTVTPTKANWVFSPTSLSYTNLTSTQTNQNIVGTENQPTTYSVSGYIKDSSGTIITSVTVTLTT